MSDKVFDNSNSGCLFDAPNMEIYRQGKCHVDGVEREFLISVTHNNQKGETYYDLYEKVGKVSPNRNKKSENSPDMIGDFQAYPPNHFEVGDDPRYMIFGNKRIGNSSKKEFTAVSVKPKEDRKPTNNTHGDNVVSMDNKSDDSPPPPRSNPF